MVFHFHGVASFQHTAFVPRRNLLGRNASESINEKDGSKAATLKFSANTSFTSGAAPKASSEKVLEFFQMEENRNYLVSSGGTQQVEAAASTADLTDRWKIEADRMDAEEPTLEDVILRVKTGSISFPGLKLVSTALIGSKLLKPSDASMYPEFQFTLITDERSVKGAPPIVWIYNQLTGGGKRDEKTKGGTAHSFSRVTVGEIGDEINFSISAMLEIDVNFPSLLLRLLPISKEKAEAQGSAAVLKTISKGIEASIMGFRDNYNSWISA